MRKLSSNAKSSIPTVLLGTLIAVCFIIVSGPVKAHFNIGTRGGRIGHFFRDFQRGAQNVFRPLMQPMTRNVNITLEGLSVLPIKMPELKMPEIAMQTTKRGDYHEFMW